MWPCCLKVGGPRYWKIPLHVRFVLNLVKYILQLILYQLNFKIKFNFRLIFFRKKRRDLDLSVCLSVCQTVYYIDHNKILTFSPHPLDCSMIHMQIRIVIYSIFEFKQNSYLKVHMLQMAFRHFCYL